MLTVTLAENGLSFIETSALDASNVEAAFQNILTGECCAVEPLCERPDSFVRYLPDCLEQVLGTICGPHQTTD